MARAHFSFQALGTHWQIDIDDLPPHQEGGLLLERIKERLERYEALYSRFRQESLLSRLARKGGTIELPPDAPKLLAMYKTMYDLTGGAVTPLIGQALVDAGYDPAYSLTPKPLSRAPRWEDTLTMTATHLTVSKPVQLDFGGLGKGYAIDSITEFLEHEGLRSFCVEAGGDMSYRNEHGENLRVGLEHPEDTSMAIGVANLASGQSICGSSGNRRSWGTYHHIINPHTLESPRHIAAVWAIASSTLLADAITSALFFVPATALRATLDFEHAIMYADHSLEASPGFNSEFFQ